MTGIKAMILAAGRGERMRPLTDHTPKPLLQVGGVPLIEYHIRRLVTAGIVELVINVSHLGEQIVAACGDGSRWGARISWSREARPLETAGGILRALPLLDTPAFLVVNADVWMDFDATALAARARALPPRCARLLFAANPAHHCGGDFALSGERVVPAGPDRPSVTFTGVGAYRRDFFDDAHPASRSGPLRPLFERAIADGRLHGERHDGAWMDVGTPERLAALREQVQAQAEPGGT
ncbi:N-acetylmuramate alpha-1-phosphate uridylyltransferase MurU [Chromatocurvus halotolerans]